LSAQFFCPGRYHAKLLLKEEIGWLKLVFGALLAVDVSLVAWLAQNYAAADRILVLAGLAATLILTGVVVWVNRLAYRRIEQLEDT
jgi:predicted phage tail protein